jgi:site-specific recombinase XerC
LEYCDRPRSYLHPVLVVAAPAMSRRNILSAFHLRVDQHCVRKYAGVEVSPHKFRHLAAKVVLDDSPGAIELVKQLLGHENLKTTTNFYSGIDTRRAARHHHSLLQRETEKKATRLGRLPRKRKADRRD